jgi:hypothetical protein
VELNPFLPNLAKRAAQMYQVVLKGLAVDNDLVDVAPRKSEQVRNVESMMRWKNAGAFLSPNGITTHSYTPSSPKKAVLEQSSIAILTWW